MTKFGKRAIIERVEKIKYEKMHPLEMILRRCQEAAPNPWYPSNYYQESGAPKDSLDPHLDRLRLGGLVHLTEWVQGTGQGYALTPEGKQVVDNPRLLARLRLGHVPLRGEQAPGPPQPGDMTQTEWERGKAVKEAVLGSSTPHVTLFLIFVNIVVFLYGVSLGWKAGDPLSIFLYGSTREALDGTGAIRGADVYLKREWWRLITACFVHIGLVHLLVNMYSLYVVGPILEQWWGRWRFLTLYLIAGIGGSCGMLIGNPVGGGAGASGALWGVIASMATWLFLNRSALSRGFISHWYRQLTIVLIINLAITFGIPGISKGGHFGGGLAGLIAAVPLDFLRFGGFRQRLCALIGLAVIPLVCVGVLYRSFEFTGEKIEVREFEELYRGRIVDAVGTGGKAWDDHSKEDAQKAIQNLAEARRELSSAIDELDKARYSSPKVNDARQRLKEYLDEFAKLLQMTEDCLKEGKDCSERDNIDINLQARQTVKKLGKWKEWLQTSRQ